MIDRHAGIISSIVVRKEKHLTERIIGLGHLVSTANLLGGEGIRHALISPDTFGPFWVVECLSVRKMGCIYFWALNKYEKVLSNNLGWRWGSSSRIALKTWWGVI